MKCISIKRLKMHEYHTTLRRMHPDERQWFKAYMTLNDFEKKSIQQIGKISTQLFLLYLTITSLRSGNNLSLSIFKIEASIPIAYALATASLMFFILATAVNHLSVVMSIRIRHGTKMKIPGFSAEVFRFLTNQNDNALGIPIFINSYIKHWLPVPTILGLSLLGVVSSISIPFFVFAGYVFNEQLSIAFDPTLPLAERASSGLGAIALVLSGLYVLLFHIPLPTKKDSFAIRWGVLYYLAPTGDHPRVKEWLKESDKK